MILQAFFDETGSGEKDELTAVAGFVFDTAGLEVFEGQWHPKVSCLPAPYRTAPCNAGREPFHSWPHEQRQRLMDDLAMLSAETALAGFASSIRGSDFKEALERNLGIRPLVVSPYMLCVISVILSVCKWIEEKTPDEKVDLLFEKGGPNWEKASEFLSRICASDAAKQFSPVRKICWLPKEHTHAFCSADLLAWEWRRNALHSPDTWTPRFNKVRARMRQEKKPILGSHIKAESAGAIALFIGLGEYHRDL